MCVVFRGRWWGPAGVRALPSVVNVGCVSGTLVGAGRSTSSSFCCKCGLCFGYVGGGRQEYELFLLL